MVDDTVIINEPEKNIGDSNSDKIHIKVNNDVDEFSVCSENRRSSRSSGNTRTTYNYVNMIVECILRSNNRRVLLSDIYKYVQTHYKDMIEKGVDWQNGIRHNLSLNDCFMKEGRNPNGKGYFWTIAPKNLHFFEQGDFRRRWSQCRTRRQRDGSESRRHTNYIMATSGINNYSGNSTYQAITPTGNSNNSPGNSSPYDRRQRNYLTADNIPYSTAYVPGHQSPINGFYPNPHPFCPRQPFFNNYHEQTSPIPHPGYCSYTSYIDPWNHSYSYTTPPTHSPQIAQNINEGVSNENSHRSNDRNSQDRARSSYPDHSMSTIINRM